MSEWNSGSRHELQPTHTSSREASTQPITTRKSAGGYQFLQAFVLVQSPIDCEICNDSMDPYARGDRLRPIRARYTFAQLAPVFGCGQKKLRDFEELGSIPQNERATTRRLGVKKTLARLRDIRKTRLRWQKQTTGQNGRELKNKLAKYVREWAEQNLAPVKWDRFFQMVFQEVNVRFSTGSNPTLLCYGGIRYVISHGEASGCSKWTPTRNRSAGLWCGRSC